MLLYLYVQGQKFVLVHYLVLLLKYNPVSKEAVLKIQKGLSFQYPHISATYTPSKQTATGRKGRSKDREASENTPEPPVVLRKWLRPAFISQDISGKEYGNVMHAVMQRISYEKCKDILSIQGEIRKLVDNGFLSSEQANSVKPCKLQRFFSSDIGRKLCGGIPYLREFKFSILDNGSHLDPSLSGEQILLQGVVDCALLEADGITVIDFKTDYVTEENFGEILSRYRVQLQTYADALQRIYEQPVKAKYLYLFHIDSLVAL